MNTFDTIIKQAAEWHPQFVEVPTLEVCADYINRPHEDYPLRVNATISTLSVIIQQGITTFGCFDAKSINSAIMIHDTRGKWRTNEVTVGYHAPPSPMKVPELVEKIFPVGIDCEDLVGWYSLFQTIHPFDDGNGRTGGVIVAALHYQKTGKWLAPKQ